MKIMYATRAQIPSQAASAVNIVQSCEAMGNLGFDVTLVCPFKLNAPLAAFANVPKFYGVKRNFRVVRFPQLFRDGRQFNEWVVRYCHRNGAFLFSRDLDMLDRAVAMGIPCLWECHSPPLNDTEWRVVKTLAASPLCLRFAVVVDWLRSHLVERLGDGVADKIMVARNAVKPDRFAETYQKALEPKKKLAAGYVGSFHPGKGWEIIPELARLTPDVDYHVYGGAPEEVARQKAEWASLPNLIFHGFVKPSRLADEMAKFEIGLLPNRVKVLVGKNEDIGPYTCPVKMFEYMAAGKVVLASDLPILREMIRPGENGMIAACEDFNEWAERIKQLCGDDGLRLNLIKTARLEVETKYSYGVRYKRVLDGVEQLVAEVG